MPKVMIEDQKSFKVQDFLAALAAKNNGYFFMIDPKNPVDFSGRAIIDTWLNIPSIGLSTHDRSQDGPLGFHVPGHKVELNDDDEYVPEALLIMDVPVQSLPDDQKEEAWVLQVKNFEKIVTFVPIAEALMKEFKVDVIITPSQMGDQDPQHMASRPVDSRFPQGAQFQPIAIRFVK